MPVLESVLVDYLVNDKLVKPGYYVGVIFREGPVFFRVMSREIITYTYIVTSVPPRSTTLTWDEVRDARGRRILEPEDERYVYQVLIGIRPETFRLYLQFPPREDRWSLIGVRAIGDLTGYIDGFESPHDNPSIRSELWTWRDLYPAFYYYNDMDTAENLYLKFYIAKCRYQIVRDKDMIRAFIEGRAKVHLWSFLDPYSIPEWLERLVGREILEYGLSLWIRR